MESQVRLGLIGTGSIVAALARSLVQSGTVQADQLFVLNRTVDKAEALQRELKCGDLQESRANPDVVVLAVKPKDFEASIASVTKFLRPEVPLISVLAGIPLPRLSTSLGNHAKVVRAMPNIACLAGKGITIWSCSPGCTCDDRALVQRLFKSVGVAIEVPSDELVDAGTALYGSGPAYLLYVMQHLRDVARELGFAEPAASQLAAQLFLGAGELVLSGFGTPESLRLAVTSPNGTTAAGMERFAAGFVGAWIEDAVRAAYERARALAKS